MALKLTLTLHDDGQLQLDGPLHDKILCFGLLEVAKDAIRSHQAKPRVQPVSVIPSLPLNGRTG